MVSHAGETLYMYVLTTQNIFLITLVLQNAVCFVADNYFLFKEFLHIYIYGGLVSLLIISWEIHDPWIIWKKCIS